MNIARGTNNRMVKARALGALLVACLLFVLGAGRAEAAAPLPVQIRAAVPSSVTAGEFAQLLFSLRNTAPVPSEGPIRINDVLPPGVTALSAGPSGGVLGSRAESSKCEIEAAGAEFSCKFAMPLKPLQTGPEILATVAVSPSASGRLENRITMSGGGIARVSRTDTMVVGGPTDQFELRNLAGSIANEDGSPADDAGAHPWEISTGFEVPTFAKPFLPNFPQPIIAPQADLKDVHALLPPGLIGNPQATPVRCSAVDLASFPTGPEAERNEEDSNCPIDSQVGTAMVFLGGFNDLWVDTPLFNVVPPPGHPAAFGFFAQGVPILLTASLKKFDGQYQVEVTDLNSSNTLPVLGTELRFWGVPDDTSHDGERKGCYEEVQQGPSGKLCPSAAPKTAFLRNPTRCTPEGETIETKISADSWQSPDTEVRGAFLTEGPKRCDRVPFAPSIEARPSTSEAASPSGLKVDLHMPQTGLESPEGIAEADLKDATVTLPEGMSVNPSSANGLEACSAAQIDLSGPQPAACPDGSKLGSVEIDTPLLDHPIDGGVYLARQGENKFGSLLAIYLAVDDPQTGVVIKLAGKIETTASGRVTARFTENPQLPFEDLHVEFFGGTRASLMTPEACGTYTTTGEFTPWSGNAPVTSTSSFQITSGPNGGPCPNGGFDPKLSAGTTNPSGGASSPFVLNVSRADGTQGLSTISATLPKGLLASLKGIPYCADPSLAAIPTAEGTGAGQLANPSCPAASQVGTVSVGAGAGPSPFYVNTGRAYLAGPYKGAPLSLAIVTPALAGPFDLGNVVVRTALKVDPETTQVTAQSDPLPTILDGIPLDLRDVRVNIDRADFTRNPTNCSEQQITTTIGGTGGAQAHPSQRFEVANCEALPFKPNLALKLKGKTRRTGHPALTATLTFPKGVSANTAKAQVGLPHSEFLDQGNIGTVCTRPQLAAHACPAGSVYGHATAVTPLLDQPLTGPVYLGTGYGTKLPMLVAELNGQIDVVLRGKIDTDPQGGIRTTFAQVPDAPISKFTLQMQGGPKKGLIENSVDICARRQKATLAFGAQNGKTLNEKVALGVTCGKAKGGKKPKKK
jgi:hypothetical protein